MKNTVKNPIIVLTGFNGCGKSYAAKLIKKDLNVGVNLNKYDLITRYILYICDIKPTTTTYSWFSSDYLDFCTLNNPKKPILYYIKESIAKDKVFNIGHLNYLLKNVFGSKRLIEGEKCKTVIDKMNMLLDHKETPDLSLIFEISEYFFINVLSEVYDWSNKLDFYKYLDLYMYSFKVLWEKISVRIVYYAYSQFEVEYMKNKFNAPVIWIEMPHVIRTNMLAMNNSDKLELSMDDEHQQEMAVIKELSTATVVNDLDFDNTIANKIKFAVEFD